MAGGAPAMPVLVTDSPSFFKETLDPPIRRVDPSKAAP